MLRSINVKSLFIMYTHSCMCTCPQLSPFSWSFADITRRKNIGRRYIASSPGSPIFFKGERDQRAQERSQIGSRHHKFLSIVRRFINTKKYVAHITVVNFEEIVGFITVIINFYNNYALVISYSRKFSDLVNFIKIVKLKTGQFRLMHVHLWR